MDDTACGVNMEVPCMDDGPSAETHSASGQLAAEQTEDDVSEALDPSCVIQNCDDYDSEPRRAGNVTAEIEEFISELRRYFKNLLGRELSTDEENEYRQLIAAWNTFLQPVQGIQDTSAIISSDIKEDINKFISSQEERRGAQSFVVNQKVIKEWLPRWNMFHQTRTGKTLVTWWNVFFTIMGFVFYILDLGSDIGTSMYYASNGQWWQAMVTLAIVYGAVIIHTIIKWSNKEIHCTGVAGWLRYVVSLLVNWPDMKQYGALCLLERKLHKSPASNAHLVPEWHQRRLNVAYLKFMEGVWEACPQAILQLCLLVPDLYGDWTWTDYLRISGASVSLCTAGAALVNREKFCRIYKNIDVPLSELVVLHVWAVPVTVSRLLSVTLLLSVHQHWALVGVALHLVLRGVYWCRAKRVPRSLADVINICINTIYFLISPFGADGSVTSRRVYHAIHFQGNTAATVVWALGTALVCAHSALYTAIICFNALMFAIGVVAWQLHENYWRREL